MCFRYNDCKTAGELVFVSKSKAKNCFRNFLNALLLNTGRQRPYTPAVLLCKILGFFLWLSAKYPSMQFCIVFAHAHQIFYENPIYSVRLENCICNILSIVV